MKAWAALWMCLCCCLIDRQIRCDAAKEQSLPQDELLEEVETKENKVRNTAWTTESPATAFTEQTCQPDIHTVLREMSALIAEQRVELRYTKIQVDALESRVRASETRLTASETLVGEQIAVIKELKERQEEQAAALRALGGSVNVTGSQVEELRREREERRVSFSASLVSSGDVITGPFDTAITLVYKHVFSNIGNAYNPNTGIFTAPVRGMYHFVFFVFGNGHASISISVSLYKNAGHIVNVHNQQASYATSSNGATLLLEAGDVIYLKLSSNSWIRDTNNHQSTFSGHLLFPM